MFRINHESEAVHPSIPDCHAIERQSSVGHHKVRVIVLPGDGNLALSTNPSAPSVLENGEPEYKNLLGKVEVERHDTGLGPLFKKLGLHRPVIKPPFGR